MKRFSLKLLWCFIIGVFSLSSCLKDDDYISRPAGFMTFVNAFADDSGLFYQIDGRLLNDYRSPLAFRSYTVAMLYEGDRNLGVYAVNQSRRLVDSTIVVKDSTAYSTFVYGTISTPKFALVQDESIDNLGEKAGFRFFNLANGVSEASIFIGDENTASFVNRPVETGSSAVSNQAFIAKENGIFTIVAKDKDGNELVKRENYNFQKGRYYTLMLIGAKDHAQRPLYIGIISH